MHVPSCVAEQGLNIVSERRLQHASLIHATKDCTTPLRYEIRTSIRLAKLYVGLLTGDVQACIAQHRQPGNLPSTNVIFVDELIVSIHSSINYQLIEQEFSAQRPLAATYKTV